MASRFNKFYVALSAFATAFGLASADGVFTTQEIGTLVVAGVGTIGVFFIKNKPAA